MSELHRLLQRQVARCRRKDGELDVDRLLSLISESYTESDDDRQRTDHALRMLVEDLNHQAEHDSLTGLANRTRFTDALTGALKTIDETGAVAVMFLDLDRFKEVNDTIGHHAGDELLRHVARRLSECVGGQGTCARLGGDEFAVIMSNLRDGPLAAECAKRIVEALSVTFDLDGNEAVIGASVGIALSNPAEEDDPETLLRCADLALYRAKTEGRGAFRFFAEEMNVRLQARKLLERQLRHAMIEGQFEL